MAEQQERHVTIHELGMTLRGVLGALRDHKNPTPEIHEVAAELSQIEQQIAAGLLPLASLRAALSVVAQFEYTPWRVPTMVEDVHKIWALIAML
ncbi:MAG: hypothetical protein ACREF3_01555 [Acetobacteraceae bacterium]